MINTNEVLKGYETGQVRRYHTHPRLAKLGQTDADHQWGVAVLLMMLVPNVSQNLLKEAITHDTGERFSADVSALVKGRYPELVKHLKEIEHHVRTNKLEGLGPFSITTEERNLLKLADSMECVLYVAIHDPDILDSHGWQELISSIIEKAQPLGLADRARDIMKIAANLKGAEEW